MPEILVISGKGGTGKTSVTGAFAHLAHNTRSSATWTWTRRICICCSSPKPARCISSTRATRRSSTQSCAPACGLCWEKCRFEAIVADKEAFRVDPLKCEGCKLCVDPVPRRGHSFPSAALRHLAGVRHPHGSHGPRPAVSGPGKLGPPGGPACRQHARELSRGKRLRVDPQRRPAGHRLPGDKFHVGHRPGGGGHRAHPLGPPRPGAGVGALPPLQGAGRGHHQQVRPQPGAKPRRSPTTATGRAWSFWPNCLLTRPWSSPWCRGKW